MHEKPGEKPDTGPNAKSESRDVEELVPESVIPAGNLPPMRYRELPEPLPFRRMIGPSVMLAGMALGSGEFIIWPYLTYHGGFVFFWACLLGVVTQYFINMEITRWSLATGESPIAGFARVSRYWGWIFIFLNTVPWVIPAWATGAGNIVSWLLWGADFDVAGNVTAAYTTPLAIASLVGCGLILTAGKVVYETVEKIQLVLVSTVILLVIVLAVWLVRGDAVAALVKGSVNIGGLPEFSDSVTVVMLLGALAFAGAGGTLNLTQGNYVRDKGYGMGKYIGRITSPITGQEETTTETGYHFPHTEENLSRWRRWWRAASWEHFWSFLVTCILCLVLLTLITYSLFYEPSGEMRADAGKYGQGMSFVWGEAVELENRIGAAVKVVFLLMGAVILLTTEFGILDAASRVSTDIVKITWLEKSARWTESRLYYVFLWGSILIGSLILVLVDPEEAKRSFTLFKYTAAMNGGVMFLYSGLLLYLNRWRLPRQVRMSVPRVIAMVWAVLFFGAFAVWVVVDKLF